MRPDLLGREVRLAVRRLANRPATAVTAIVTLTLTIGAMVSMLSLIDRVLVRPLGVPEPDRLVVVQRITNRDGVERRRSSMSWELYQRLLDASMSTLDGLTVSSASTERRANELHVSFEAGTSPEYARGLFVTDNYFRILGLRPATGRDFGPVDDTNSSVPVAILSHRLWRQRFGSDMGALGRTMEINGVLAQIVGVAPPGFAGTDLSTVPPDLFLPLMTASRVLGPGGTQTDGRGMGFTPGYPGAVPSPISPISRLVIIGRIRDGSVVEQAQAEFSALVDPEAGQSLVPLSQVALPFQSRSEIVQFLSLLTVAVGLTLLLGCANLAGLLTARVEERRGEIAIRAALGAGRAQLVRELAGEAVVLAVAGGAAALVLGQWINRGMAIFALPGGIPVGSLRGGVDGRMIFFTVLVTAMAAIVISLGPAWLGANFEIGRNLGGKSGSPKLGTTLSLVFVQLTFSVVLVYGAILFVRSVSEALATDMGFDSSGLLSVSVRPPPSTSSRQAYAARQSLDSFAERAGEIPGVSGVTIGPMPLLRGSDTSTARVLVDSVSVNLPAALEITYIGSEYFTVIGQRLVRGRDFNARDGATPSLVGIVNESAARRFWPDDDPLGRQFAFPLSNTAITVVGVVRDAKLKDLRDDGRLAVYLARSQHRHFLSGFLAALGNGFLILRTSNDRASVILSLRAAAEDAGLSLGDVTTFDEVIGTILMPQRLGRVLLTFLGALALVLASVGIYGLVSCAVARTEMEIGLRRALGASDADVMRAIAKRMLWPVVGGLAGGAAFAWWGGRFADRFMYGVSGSDPTAIVLAVTLLAIVAGGAALMPVRRALRVNPVELLRTG